MHNIYNILIDYVICGTKALTLQWALGTSLGRLHASENFQVGKIQFQIAHVWAARDTVETVHCENVASDLFRDKYEYCCRVAYAAKCDGIRGGLPFDL